MYVGLPAPRQPGAAPQALSADSSAEGLHDDLSGNEVAFQFEFCYHFTTENFSQKTSRVAEHGPGFCFAF